MSVVRGVRCFGEGGRLARRPGLRRYVLVPALVSACVVGGGLALAFGYADDASLWLAAWLPDWLDFLSLILVPLLYVLAVLVGAWLFGFVAVLLAGPFMGDFALAVEQAAFGQAPRPESGFWRGIASGVLRELRKLGYYLPRLLVVFAVSFVPVVNAFAPLLWFGFGAWILAIQFCDYPAENRGRPFPETLALLRRNRAAALGFRGCATLALAGPLLNFLLVPVAVAGGTVLWRRLAAPADGQTGSQVNTDAVGPRSTN